ncbi:McrC family protein [Psychrobacter sp. TWP2-1-2]|uniref:McrC family protein n=1 Tax=Psychrobacter sp. TWP2-1-2 TaxID=2804623 RepID=UPI003CEBECB7
MINNSFSHEVIANNIDSANVNALDVNTITVFEHQRLTAHDFLRVSDFHWLMAQEFAVFSIKHRQGQWQLKVGHYIGVILLPSGMTLEILPKLAAKTSSDQVAQQSYLSQNASRRHASHRPDIRQARQWVQGMLSDLTNSSHAKNKLPNTKNLGQFSSQLSLLSIDVLPLSDWLITQFLQRLAHYRPSKHYQTQVDNQASLQGRLLIKEQLRHNRMQPHKFVCESSILSQDMLGNRLIKSTLVLMTPLFFQSTLSKADAPKFLQAWQRVAALSYQELTQLESIYTQAKRQLAVQPLRAPQLQAAQQLLDMAYWLLMQSNVATGNGIAPNKPSRQNLSSPRLCLLIDMNQAFEQWASLRIASMFQQVSQQYQPLYQTQSIWLTDAEGRACLSIRPDLLIYKTNANDNCHNQNGTAVIEAREKGHYSHVIDIKWKHLSQTASISASDAYQLMSYAQAYQAGQVWLVYPVQDNERLPVALSQQVHDYKNTDGPNNHDNNHNVAGEKVIPAPLWLVPFNVLTGTINGSLLPDWNRV